MYNIAFWLDMYSWGNFEYYCILHTQKFLICSFWVSFVVCSTYLNFCAQIITNNNFAYYDYKIQIPQLQNYKAYIVEILRIGSFLIRWLLNNGITKSPQLIIM